MGLSLYTAEVKKFNPGYELTRHEVRIGSSILTHRKLSDRKHQVYEMFDEFMANIDDTRGFYMHMDGVRLLLHQERMP